MTTVLEGMAADRREPFIIRAVAEALARHRRVEVLRSAAGLWDTYDWLPGSPDGIVEYVRAQGRRCGHQE